MTTSTAGLAIVALVFAAQVAVGGQTAPAAKPAEAKAPAGRVDQGATLFKKVGCYQCHANEGQGGLAGPRIAPNPIAYSRFLQYLRAPAGDMPPYTAKVLTNQDVADIYAFLEARPRPPAVESLPQLRP